jgi:hypothetical protein
MIDMWGVMIAGDCKRHVQTVTVWERRMVWYLFWNWRITFNIPVDFTIYIYFVLFYQTSDPFRRFPQEKITYQIIYNLTEVLFVL